ncbi:hypothetical protein Tco_1143430 [Tanacetum coccineum]
MMAEYVSVYNATAMLWRNLITGLKIINSISRPLKIYCDNSAAVSFSNSNSSTRAGLYLDTKYLSVRERVEEQRISIEHIRTHEMLADPLTKGLPPKDCPDCEDSQFCHSSRVSHPQLHLGIRYPNLID